LTFGSDQNTDPRKDSLKSELISKILSEADTLLGKKKTFKSQSVMNKPPLPGNAFFISYQTYKSKQNSFKEEYETKFGSDFKKYLGYLKDKYPSL
jgi:hypothetical protein